MPNPLPPLRVMRYFREQAWAMLPSAYHAMEEVIAARVAGQWNPTPAEIESRIEAARRPTAMASAPGNIAVVPVFGVLAQHGGPLEEISGITSTESLMATYRQAFADPNVVGLVSNFCTPGGSVFGIQETADYLWSMRGTKPHLGIVNSQCASAGLWIASQCDNLAITPGGEAGSYGIIASFENIGKAAEAAGVSVEFLTEPEGGYKAEGNPYEPLTAEARAYQQARLKEYYGMFGATLARGRKMSVSAVNAKFGEGRMMGAKAAVEAGMVDRIATFQEVVDGMVAKQRKGARAEGNVIPISAATQEPSDLDTSSLAIARARLALAARRLA